MSKDKKKLPSKNNRKRGGKGGDHGGRGGGRGRSDNVSKKKHTPIMPPNTACDWSQNKHLNREPFKIGDAQRAKELAVKVKAKNGKVYEFKYPQGVDWNNKSDVSKANNWRRQIFRRRLMKQADLEKFRAPWTAKEQGNIKQLIRKKLRKSPNKLSMKDWQDISKAHNQRFAGKRLKAGEPLAQAITARSGKLSLSGKTLPAGAARPLEARSAAAIMSMVTRWPDIQSMIEGMSAGLQAKRDTADGEVSTDSDSSGSDLTELDTDIDFDHDSDSESDIDGEVPAKNPTGATEIAAMA